MGDTRRARVMVAHVGRQPSFVRRDLELLASRYDVVAAEIGPASSLVPAIRALRSVDCLVCWFGSFRFLPLAAAARALGTPVAIIAGGYDLASLPEIGYGNMRPGRRRLLARALFRMADVTVCVSRAAAAEAATNGAIPTDRIRIVYNAFDGDRIGADLCPSEKERLVLTVAGVDESTLTRKGLLTVARTSRLMPDVPFVLVGRWTPAARERLVAEAGDNLTLAGFVADEALDRLYRRARVCYQPSAHEAFGCSVAEAMLYNCIPVVASRFALPEVVGPCGVYVEPDAPAQAVPVLRRALEGDVALPERPRARILREFPAAARGEQLGGILDGIMSGRR